MDPNKLKGHAMTPQPITEALQSVFFDLCDLAEKLDCDRIKLRQFYEFTTLADFIEEQKSRLAAVETYLNQGA